ncbi:MAG: hypothetical protein P4L99_14290 [Chthoniobacter sp.]|nr:hypothetical protein [Chthoniobacter sp.]
MKIEEFNPGHSFRVGGVTYARLCRYLSDLSGVVFTKRRRFFWFRQNVGAEFTFHGQKFVIDSDQWEYALWILTGDQQNHVDEMQMLREHIEHRR